MLALEFSKGSGLVFPRKPLGYSFVIFHTGIREGVADPSLPSGSTHVLYQMLKALNEIDGVLYFYAVSY